jgi:hypothetical protein
MTSPATATQSPTTGSSAGEDVRRSRAAIRARTSPSADMTS